MVSLPALLSDAADRLDDLLPLAAVPLLLGLVSLNKFDQVAAAEGTHFGVSFGIPIPVTTGWSFVSLPNRAQGVTVETGSVASFVPFAALALLGSALLGAGYVGSIDRILEDRRIDFAADVRRYLAPFVGFGLLVLAALLVAVGLVLVAVPLALLAFLLFFVAAYLLWAAPYLVVVAEMDLGASLSRSYGYAVEGGAYASYFVQYLLAVAAISLVATPLFTNAGLAGGLAGVVLLAPLGLLFDTATTAFVRDFVDADGEDDPGDGDHRDGDGGNSAGDGGGDDDGGDDGGSDEDGDDDGDVGNDGDVGGDEDERGRADPQSNIPVDM